MNSLASFFTSLLLYFPLFCYTQFNLYSDFYVAPNTELHITAPTTTFADGKFLTDHGTEGGIVSFASNSAWSNANNNSHVDGNVKIYTPTQFEFPLGHDNVFQPLAISEASGVSFLTVNYQHLPYSNLSPSAGLLKIHPAHYWNLQQGNGTAKVQLSWNEFSALDAFLDGLELEDLTVVGYKDSAWELIPSGLDPNTNNTSLSGILVSDSPIALNQYSALALAAKGLAGPDGTPLDIPLVAEGLSPNGDGDNDTWYIEGIERFPNAKVNVYNRTGENVFQANNGYNNDWRGDWKNSGNTLPSGPYFYTIDLDDDGALDLQGWLYVQQ